MQTRNYVRQKFEDGFEVQFRIGNSDWFPANFPNWDENLEYRVAPYSCYEKGAMYSATIDGNPVFVKYSNSGVFYNMFHLSTAYDYDRLQVHQLISLNDPELFNGEIPLYEQES